jgi:hypothetical protein
LLGKILNNEMGFFLEQELFGSEILIDEIDENSASIILNEKNY